MDNPKNTTAADGAASTPHSLIDAIDLLTEARQVNEAAHMACMAISDRTQVNALQRIVGIAGDILQMLADSLDELRAEAGEGEAS